jgi:hypothetical protein
VPTWESQPGWGAAQGWGVEPGPGSENQAPTGPPGWGVEPGPGPGQPAQGWGQQPTQGWGPPPAPRRPSRRTPPVVGGIAVLLVVAVVAALSLRDSGGQRTASPASTAPFAPGAGGAAPGGGTPGGGTPGGGGAASSLRLPDQVGGLPRIPLGDASLLGGQQGLLDLLGGSGALDGYGLGAYGPDASDPRFVLLVVRTREASSAGPIAGTMVDALRNTLGDLSEPQAFTRNGVRYECADGSLGGLCSFQNGATVGVGFSRDSDLDQLSRLTDEARRGARG